MKDKKKWIKVAACVAGVGAVGAICYYLGGRNKFTAKEAFQIGDSGWLGGVRDTLRMIPIGQEVIFDEHKLEEIRDTLRCEIKRSVKYRDALTRTYKDGVFVNNF